MYACLSMCNRIELVLSSTTWLLLSSFRRSPSIIGWWGWGGAFGIRHTITRRRLLLIDGGENGLGNHPYIQHETKVPLLPFRVRDDCPTPPMIPILFQPVKPHPKIIQVRILGTAPGIRIVQDKVSSYGKVRGNSLEHMIGGFVPVTVLTTIENKQASKPASQERMT